ncbi:MAG: adenine deaminase C-terminal domain-containing protein [Moorellales bacterium]
MALGKQPPDLLVRNVTVLNVHAGLLLPNRCVAVAGPVVANVSREDIPCGPGTVVLEGQGRFLVPAFIDAHAHLDEGVVTVPEFLRYALPGGTTAFVSDSAEVANAMGYQGVTWFLESISDQPAHVWALISPMVPGHPELLPGHRLSREQVAELLARPEVVGLGESYWTRVVSDEGELTDLFCLAQAAGKVAEGHGAGAKAGALAVLACSGVSSCHEAISAEEVYERLAAGIFTILREGSVRKDLAALGPLAGEKLDFRHLGLGTDGVNPVDLLRHGAMEYAVQRAIDLGLDPIRAIQMATINNATHFHLEGILGSITPGRYADFLLLDDLYRVRRPAVVVSGGRIVAREGRLAVSPRPHPYPEAARRVLDFARRFSAEELVPRLPVGCGSAEVRVIHQRNDVVTEERHLKRPVAGGLMVLEPGINLAMSVSTLDPRYCSVGVVTGWNLRAGACASSATWDAPQIAGIGASAEELALAVNRVGELGGGVVVCKGKKILAELPLPVGGIITELPVEETAERMQALAQHLRSLGYPYDNPLLALRVLGYVGVPRLRITARGLVRVGSNGGELVSLLV